MKAELEQGAFIDLKVYQHIEIRDPANDNLLGIMYYIRCEGRHIRIGFNPESGGSHGIKFFESEESLIHELDHPDEIEGLGDIEDCPKEMLAQ